MTRPRVSIVAAALGLAPLLAAAGDRALDPGAAAKGKVTFERYCVACHGTAAKGDGSLSQDLRVPVPDLTEIANRNAGSYPFDRVTRIVTTAEVVRGHGTVEMPAWGPALARTEGIEEKAVETAIRNLNHYLWSLQSPPPAGK